MKENQMDDAHTQTLPDKSRRVGAAVLGMPVGSGGAVPAGVIDHAYNQEQKSYYCIPQQVKT
jgi:hypothetical protein